MMKEVTFVMCQRAERTIQRLRGQRLASLSPKDKDALIASLATLVGAAGSGRRPSPHVISSVWQDDWLATGFSIDVQGQTAGG